MIRVCQEISKEYLFDKCLMKNNLGKIRKILGDFLGQRLGQERMARLCGIGLEAYNQCEAEIVTFHRTLLSRQFLRNSCIIR